MRYFQCLFYGERLNFRLWWLLSLFSFGDRLELIDDWLRRLSILCILGLLVSLGLLLGLLLLEFGEPLLLGSLLLLLVVSHVLVCECFLLEILVLLFAWIL